MRNHQGAVTRTIALWPGGTLAQRMPQYIQDLQPGGKFEYVAKALGGPVTPIAASVRIGETGMIVDRWKAGLGAEEVT